MTHRALQHLHDIGRRYPGAWRSVEQFRADRGAGLPDWPEWCYMPLAGAYAIVSGGGYNTVPTDSLLDISILGALCAWRPTQGIYRLDTTLLTHLWDTPIAGDLPCELLRHLPEWCVYVETPGQTVGNPSFPLHGFFAHLEWDANTGREELRLVLDLDNHLAPIPLHLGSWTLGDAIRRVLEESGRHGVGQPGSADLADALYRCAEPFVSILLYLCSTAAEWAGERPRHPVPKRTKRGLRLFPPDKPRVWEVGLRLGAALRIAYQAEGAPAPQETHASPRGHIRRAHWHGFWTGSGEARRLDVRWMPPIPVNLDPGEGTAVVRPVQ